MGVQLSMDNIRTIAGSILAAMAAAGGGRLIAGEVLRLIPGIGIVAGGMIISTIAFSATCALGYGYTEFLCSFCADQKRMPDGEEIKDGFRKFWENWRDKDKDFAPPEANTAVTDQKLLLPSKDT